MVALDYADAASAERLLSELEGIPCYMKVGMRLYAKRTFLRRRLEETWLPCLPGCEDA